MALVINGSTVPATGTIKYNGTSLTSVKCNGTEIWHKMNTLQTVTIQAAVVFGSTTSNGTRTLTLRIQTPQSGTSTGTLLKAPLRAAFGIVIGSGSLQTKSVTINENDWTASTVITIGNSDACVWTSINFYNEDDYLLSSNSVSQTSTSATMNNSYTVNLLEAA